MAANMSPGRNDPVNGLEEKIFRQTICAARARKTESQSLSCSQALLSATPMFSSNTSMMPLWFELAYQESVPVAFASVVSCASFLTHYT